MRKPFPSLKLSRVIVDTRDASQDRLVPPERVRELTAAGILSYDWTNQMPCVPDNGNLPACLMGYARVG